MNIHLCPRKPSRYQPPGFATHLQATNVRAAIKGYLTRHEMRDKLEAFYQALREMNDKQEGHAQQAAQHQGQPHKHKQHHVQPEADSGSAVGGVLGKVGHRVQMLMPKAFPTGIMGVPVRSQHPHADGGSSAETSSHGSFSSSPDASAHPSMDPQAARALQAALRTAAAALHTTPSEVCGVRPSDVVSAASHASTPHGTQSKPAHAVDLSADPGPHTPVAAAHSRTHSVGPVPVSRRTSLTPIPQQAGPSAGEHPPPTRQEAQQEQLQLASASSGDEHGAPPLQQQPQSIDVSVDDALAAFAAGTKSGGPLVPLAVAAPDAGAAQQPAVGTTSDVRSGAEVVSSPVGTPKLQPDASRFIK